MVIITSKKCHCIVTGVFCLFKQARTAWHSKGLKSPLLSFSVLSPITALAVRVVMVLFHMTPENGLVLDIFTRFDYCWSCLLRSHTCRKHVPHPGGQKPDVFRYCSCPLLESNIDHNGELLLRNMRREFNKWTLPRSSWGDSCSRERRLHLKTREESASPSRNFTTE